MGILSAVYHIPVAFVRGRGAFTNTAPTAPYRSAGRPEVIFVIERLIDLAADRLALDPVALRQRNLIPSAAQPYTNPLGLSYDSGDYEQVMERALALADWQGFRLDGRRRGGGANGAASASPTLSKSQPARLASALRSPCSRMGRSSW